MTDQPKLLTFPPDLYKRLVPGQYLSQHLAATPSIRPDARRPGQFRDIAVTTGSLSNTNGSAVVRNGQTVMVCGVRAEIIEPDAFAPTEGIIVPNIDLGPLCHSSIKPGPPSSQQQALAYQLRQILEVYPIFDLAQLCIEKGKAVWILYIDIVCLSSSGSLLSTAYLSMITALKSTSLPVSRWNKDIIPNAVRCKHEFLPVKVNSAIYLLEFAIFDDIVLADPSDDEAELAQGTLVVTMSVDGTSLGVRKAGAPNIGMDALGEVLDLCQERVKLVHEIVDRGKRHML